MFPEIGLFALVVALAVAVVQSVVPLVGAHRNEPSLMAVARHTAVLQGALVLFAFLCLLHAFAVMDFSVELVAEHSHSTQPYGYRLAAAWGNHEGSMLLWVLVLTLFGAAIALGGRHLRPAFLARVLAVQGMIGVAFLSFTIFTSNPFARLSPAPADGAELNPLLQDPGLVSHPPLLYLGYVGFSVAFSFAIAALLEGRIDVAWARWVRPWVLAAWSFLTCGIALGSFWAYYELGWGGWWFWDPVENASLMPWILGTALLHSVLVLERRGALVSWTILLAILTFTFSVIGTFLVRSGVLTSVHAFAVDPTRGVYILAMVALFTGAGFAMFAWRAPHMKGGALFTTISRESSLTLNNLLLLVATAVVFLGTFYPMAVDILSDGKISVGPPYYNLTFVPIALLLALAVPFGPVLHWRRDRLPRAMHALRIPALGAALLFLALLVATGLKHALAVFGLGVAAWLILGTMAVVFKRWRIGSGSTLSWSRRLATMPLASYGMVIAHIGLGVTIAGISAMAGFAEEELLVMEPGEEVAFAGHDMKLLQLRQVHGPNYEAEQAIFAFTRGRQRFTLMPERRFYPVRETMTTEAAIRARIGGNTYLAIGEQQDGGVVVRAYFHPLVGWIWGGALFMAMGGFVALSDRKFRLGVRAPAAGPLGRPLPA